MLDPWVYILSKKQLVVRRSRVGLKVPRACVFTHRGVQRSHAKPWVDADRSICCTEATLRDLGAIGGA